MRAGIECGVLATTPHRSGPPVAGGRARRQHRDGVNVCCYCVAHGPVEVGGTGPSLCSAGHGPPAAVARPGGEGEATVHAMRAARAPSSTAPSRAPPPLLWWWWFGARARVAGAGVASALMLLLAWRLAPAPLHPYPSRSLPHPTRPPPHTSRRFMPPSAFLRFSARACLAVCVCVCGVSGLLAQNPNPLFSFSNGQDRGSWQSLWGRYLRPVQMADNGAAREDSPPADNKVRPNPHRHPSVPSPSPSP